MLFPLPLGPTRATVSPGASSRSTPVEDGAEAGGVGERDRLQPDRDNTGIGRPEAARRDLRRLLQQVEETSATARPSALAWYCAARLRSGR